MNAEPTLFDFAKLPSWEATQTRDGKELYSDSPHNMRPLKADGAVGILVRGLKEGKFFTIQSAIDFLHENGKISNCADRRLREARHYLENHGYKIKEIEKETCLAWGLEQNR